MGSSHTITKVSIRGLPWKWTAAQQTQLKSETTGYQSLAIRQPGDRPVTSGNPWSVNDTNQIRLHSKLTTMQECAYYEMVVFKCTLAPRLAPLVQQHPGEITSARTIDWASSATRRHETHKFQNSSDSFLPRGSLKTTTSSKRWIKRDTESPQAQALILIKQGHDTIQPFEDRILGCGICETMTGWDPKLYIQGRVAHSSNV